MGSPTDLPSKDIETARQVMTELRHKLESREEPAVRA